MKRSVIRSRHGVLIHFGERSSWRLKDDRRRRRRRETVSVVRWGRRNEGFVASHRPTSLSSMRKGIRRRVPLKGIDASSERTSAAKVPCAWSLVRSLACRGAGAPGCFRRPREASFRRGGRFRRDGWRRQRKGGRHGSGKTEEKQEGLRAGSSAAMGGDKTVRKGLEEQAETRRRQRAKTKARGAQPPRQGKKAQINDCICASTGERCRERRGEVAKMQRSQTERAGTKRQLKEKNAWTGAKKPEESMPCRTTETAAESQLLVSLSARRALSEMVDKQRYTNTFFTLGSAVSAPR